MPTPTNLTKICNDIKKLGRKLQKHHPGINVMIQGVPTLHRTGKMQDATRNINSMLKDMAGKNSFKFISSKLPKLIQLYAHGGSYYSDVGLRMVFFHTLNTIQKFLIDRTYNAEERPDTSIIELSKGCKGTRTKANPGKKRYPNHKGTPILETSVEKRKKPTKIIIISDSFFHPVADPGIARAREDFIADLEMTILPGFRLMAKSWKTILDTTNVKTLKPGDTVVIAIGTNDVTARRVYYTTEDPRKPKPPKVDKKLPISIPDKRPRLTVTLHPGERQHPESTEPRRKTITLRPRAKQSPETPETAGPSRISRTDGYEETPEKTLPSLQTWLSTTVPPPEVDKNEKTDINPTQKRRRTLIHRFKALNKP